MVRNLNPEQAGIVRCLGIESHDIISIASKTVRDIQINFLQKNPSLLKEGRPIRIVIDASDWKNETDQTLNLNFIADQLAIALQRNANNKMAFLSREDLDSIKHERKLKREGLVDKGALGLVDKIAGADYRMGGRLGAQRVSSSRGERRSTYLALWLVDLETGARVWVQINNLLKEGSSDGVC